MAAPAPSAAFRRLAPFLRSPASTMTQALEGGLISRHKSPKHALIYGPPRAGDIRDSLASTHLMETNLGYTPLYTFEEGVEEYLSFVLK